MEPTPTEIKILNELKYEAASIFKVGDIYYGLFSGCTGWDPNPGRSAYTYNILGEWTTGVNFAVDKLKQVTYNSQSNYVFQLPGKDKAFIYMGIVGTEMIRENLILYGYLSACVPGIRLLNGMTIGI